MSFVEKRGTIKHILLPCNVSLTQSRNKWRRDQILRELADIPKMNERRKTDRRKKRNIYIYFVRELIDTASVEKSQKQKPILDSATYWKMQEDLGQQLVFPGTIQTNLQTNLILYYSPMNVRRS